MQHEMQLLQTHMQLLPYFFEKKCENMGILDKLLCINLILNLTMEVGCVFKHKIDESLMS